MNADTLPFVMLICIVGNVALIPLILAFGLIGVMRKIGDWIEAPLMDVVWAQLQALFVLVLFYPLVNLAAFAAGAALLLGLAELLMYATYRVLTRMGLFV